MDTQLDVRQERADRKDDASKPGSPFAENIAVAAKLNDFAELLDQQGADGFRARAYRGAAETVAALKDPVSDILAREGRAGLVSLPRIGEGIAGAIMEMVATGRWSQLDRLRGDLVPEALFRTLPGIGPELAHRLAEDAQLESLEELEAALHLGDMKIEGLGPRRRAMLAASLAERLGRPFFPHASPNAGVPPVAMLLEVDRMYRDKAAKGELRTIAPKRFNPAGKAWLPILHARHGDWHFTALYSNTLRAHQLGRTRDWVVIHFHADGQSEGRCTVVTEARGPLAGRRVVRGREDETPTEEQSP